MALTPNSTLAALAGTTPTAEIDNAANKAQVRVAIGAMENTAEAVLDKLKGAAEDPERIGAEYMPDAIEADWLETSDMAGETIPAGAYSRKGNIPYFGDSPLRDQLVSSFGFNALLSIDAAKLYSVYLGSFPIAASDAVDGKNFFFTLDATMDDFGSGMPVAPTTQKFYLFARLGAAAAPSISEGSILELTPTALHERRKIFGSLQIGASGGGIQVALGTLQAEKITAPDTTTAAVTLPFVEPACTTANYYPSIEGVATTIELYLVANATVSDFAILFAKGKLEVMATDYTQEPFA
jgi:hypothetical protein